ncbi:hypothetical protein HPP92_027559 [Vanilla planifolia]|uniref:RING-type E3 ubiquitin transferase n=1 Tax=Vanilla planifolia TaxID=51239 RepID=A0A835PAN8_VANPL|nr:hypothetical protein HPP92_027559 [Vanilla planifolia]
MRSQSCCFRYYAPLSLLLTAFRIANWNLDSSLLLHGILAGGFLELCNLFSSIQIRSRVAELEVFAVYCAVPDKSFQLLSRTDLINRKWLPQDLEDNAPLSSTHDTLSAASMLRVDPNLGVMVPSDSHEPNSLQALVDLTNTQADARDRHQALCLRDMCFDGRRFEDPEICRGLNESESKNASDLVSNSPKVKEELSTFDAPTTPFTEDEDVCPTCLEEYDAENPRIITKCKHHFHLSCILEWLERSNTCAICDKIMEVEDVVVFGQAL